MPASRACRGLCTAFILAALTAAWRDTLDGRALAQQRPPQLGSMLVPRMQLVYAGNGVESPPWFIDSVAKDTILGGRAGCVRIRLRLSPTRPAPDTRAHCADSTTMYNWDDRSAELRPARPIKAGASLEIPQRSGGRVRFETAAISVERITLESLGSTGQTAPAAVEVIPTVVTTIDSTGRVVRRLRERFSVALATATGGVFEVPDSTQAGGWRTVQRFELVAIRVP